MVLKTLKKTFNKKNVLPIALAIASLGIAQVHAAESGPYIGGQLGWGNINEDNTKDSGLAGRAYAGWLINKYFGLETGYTKFKNINISESDSSFFDSYSVNGTVSAYAIDLVAKAILPLQYGFSVYGKLGAAYLHESANLTVKYASPFLTMRDKASAKAHNFYPTFGAGVSYDVTQNITADLSWNRIQRVGSADRNNLDSTDFVGFGLNYNFG